MFSETEAFVLMLEGFLLGHLEKNKNLQTVPFCQKGTVCPISFKSIGLVTEVSTSRLYKCEMRTVHGSESKYIMSPDG